MLRRDGQRKKVSEAFCDMRSSEGRLVPPLCEKLARLRGAWTNKFYEAAQGFFSCYPLQGVLMCASQLGNEFRPGLILGYGRRLGEIVDEGCPELILFKGSPAYTYAGGRLPGCMDTFVDYLIEAVGKTYAEPGYVHHRVLSRDDFRDLASAITYALPIHRTVIPGYKVKPSKDGCVILRMA